MNRDALQVASSDDRGLNPLVKAMVTKLEAHRQELDAIAEQVSAKLDDYQRVLGSTIDTTVEIEQSWSGSWIGYHAELYYEGFSKPPLNRMFNPEWGGIRGLPDGWQPRSWEDVRAFVLDKHRGHRAGEIDGFVEQVAARCMRLKDKICADLSLLRALTGFGKEVELLDRLDRHEWGVAADQFVQQVGPSQHITRDSVALSQGLRVPPHVTYWAGLQSLSSKLSSIAEFVRLSQRLVAQVGVRLSAATGSAAETSAESAVDDVTRILHICNRFHVIAKDLARRHAGRHTIMIEDEYDVQDLLHALLRLYFDDIRHEEWTPSYAGGSSRMDFLLKREQIVVEVKKTRSGLTDAEVGRQLLEDKERYGDHQDCQTLICFVYDPGGLIRNPRGLESDLGRGSTERLKVIAVVRPQ